MFNYPKDKIMWLLCTGVVCYLCFYVANVYLLHQLSIGEFGDFAVSLKALAIICAFLTISKQLSLSLYMPQFEKSHRYVQRNGIALWLGKNLILAAIILITGVIFTKFVFYMINNQTFVSVFQDHPWQFILFFIPIVSFVSVLSSLLLSQKERIKAMAPFITIFPGLVVITIFSLGMHIFNLPPKSIICIYFICQTIVVMLYLFLSHNYCVPIFLAQHSTDVHDQWYTCAHTYWVGTLSNQISTVLSLIALAYLSPKEFVGGYAIILLFVASYVALISPLQTYLASQLDQLLHSDSEKLKQIIKLIVRIQSLIVILAVSICITFGKELLIQINPHVEYLYPQLIFAMVMFGFAISSTIPLRVLLHTSLPDVGIYLKISRLLLCCLLLSILVPHYGIVGAIISDTIPLILINGAAFIVCKRNLNFSLI